MRSKKYLMYGILVVLVISIGVTFAYFQTSVENKNGKLSINSKEINIIFTDTTEISEERITPGWSTSKSFSVENKSNDVFNYNIVLEDLINTFETVGNLQYKITSTNGYNMNEYADIPKSKEREDVILAYDIDIEKGVKQEYTIEFIYKNSTEDQSIDMNKELSGVLAITEGSIDPSKYYSVEINLENGTITSENPQESLKKGSLTYTYELNEGYEINGTEVICSGSAKGEISGYNIIIRDIREDQVCTISPSKKRYIVDIKVNNGSSDALNKHIEYLGSDIFNITANYGYTISEAIVTGEGCTIEGSIVTVSNVTTNQTCEVTLKKDKYNVYLSGANISVDASPKLVEYEGSVAFIVTPSVGYTLDNSVVNCDNGATSIRTNNNVTVRDITKETRCEITPVQLSYNLTLNVVNGNGGGSKVVNHGGTTTFTISANDSYTTENPTISCTGSANITTNGNNITISNVTTEQTCTVELQKDEHTLTMIVNGGSTSPTNLVIKNGGGYEFTISPSTGYVTDGMTVSCTGSATKSINSNKVSITNITETQTCTINLTPLPKVTLTVKHGSGGSTKQVKSLGGSVTFSVNPYTDYDSAGTISGDCTFSGSTVTASNVYSNRNCTLTFNEITYSVTLNNPDLDVSMTPKSDKCTGVGCTITFKVTRRETCNLPKSYVYVGACDSDVNIKCPGRTNYDSSGVAYITFTSTSNKYGGRSSGRYSIYNYCGY